MNGAYIYKHILIPTHMMWDATLSISLARFFFFIIYFLHISTQEKGEEKFELMTSTLLGEIHSWLRVLAGTTCQSLWLEGFFFFFDMFTQGKREEKCELVTSTLLSEIYNWLRVLVSTTCTKFKCSIIYSTNRYNLIKSWLWT